MSREDVYAGILLAVVAAGILGVVVAHHFFGIDLVAYARFGTSRRVLGWVFAGLAVAIAMLNIYLTYVLPWLYRREHGSMLDYSGMSGLPIIGGFFVLLAGALLPASAPVGIFLLSVYCSDTLGLPWFFFALVARRQRP